MTFLVNPFILGGVPAGQWVYDSVGETTFTVPDGVTSISILCVGGGGVSDFGVTNAHGGGGGALSYSNDVTVTPGEELTVYGSFFSSPNSYALVARGGTILVSAQWGSAQTGGAASAGVGDVRYSGGYGGMYAAGGGGGGAAGYAGNGGNGAHLGNPAQSGAGGSGGGGGTRVASGYGAGGGGGVGLLGIGTSGAAGSPGHGGHGGSGGEDGGEGSSNGDAGDGGEYGAGGGGMGVPGAHRGGRGGSAIRIIWGEGRSYPNNAGDV